MSRLFFLLFISIFLAACSSNEKQSENLPIVIETKSQVVQIDQVISDTQLEVQRTLPDAYLTFFSFVGQCSDLPNLQGKLRLDFAHIRQSLFGGRTFLARAEIDTMSQTLSFNTKDETEHYPDLEPLVINGKGIQEIATILHDHLISKNACTDVVVLTRVRTESPWRVRCGPPEKVLLECLEIDPETGEVVERK